MSLRYAATVGPDRQYLIGQQEAGPVPRCSPRGRGLAYGLAFQHGELARKVSSLAFERGLLVETAGADDEVIKLLPPLTITDSELDQGLAILADAVRTVC